MNEDGASYIFRRTYSSGRYEAVSTCISSSNTLNSWMLKDGIKECKVCTSSQYYQSINITTPELNNTHQCLDPVNSKCPDQMNLYDKECFANTTACSKYPNSAKLYNNDYVCATKCEKFIASDNETC